MADGSLVQGLRANLNRVIKGKPREVDLLITALLGGGNVLLTDVPGVGKTTLAKALAASISLAAGSTCSPREGSRPSCVAR